MFCWYKNKRNPGTKITNPSGKQEVIKESSSVTTSEKTEIKNPNKESQKGGVSYETDNDGVKYNTDSDNKSKESSAKSKKETDKKISDTKRKDDDGVSDGVKSKKTQTTKPNNVKASTRSDEVKSFHTGETITRDSLKGTPIENADMNAVSLLHPEDLETLKDTEKVNSSINQAKQAKKENLNSNLSKLEKQVLKEASEAKVILENNFQHYR